MLPPGWILTAVAAVLTVTGFTAENITIVYWTEGAISQYGVLLFNNIFFPLVFGIMLLSYALFYGDWTILRLADKPNQRSYFKWGSLAQICVLTGFFNILNGFLIVYASPPTRTPPLVQAVLQNAGVVFSIPFSKLILGDRKQYTDRMALLACGLIIASVTVSILPTIIQGKAGEDINGSTTVVWCLIYLFGLAPGAAYNVLQQLYLIKSGVLKEGVTPKDVGIASSRMLFYTNLFQALSLVAMFWVDMLPWFGASSGLGEFWANTVFSVTCSFGGPGAVVTSSYPADTTDNCDGATPAYAFGFMVGYCVVYVGSALLNRESATFNMLVSVVTTMCTSAFWLIPGTNPQPQNTPLWSVLVSLTLSLIGIVVWKVWENKTPSHEQFAVEYEEKDKSLYTYDLESDTYSVNASLLEEDRRYAASLSANSR